MKQSRSVKEVTEFVADAVRQARSGNAPFYHLQFDRVFPPDFYEEMLRTMPDENDYRPMSGKTKMGSSRSDGKPTRTKIDLFPEYIRHLPPEKFAVWDLVGRVLRSKELKNALKEKLGPGLQKRFGKNFAHLRQFAGMKNIRAVHHDFQRIRTDFIEHLPRSESELPGQ